MASIKDIADLAGISKAAVSVYLKDPETTRVGPATKARIREAVERLNYSPNRIAQSLSTKRTNVIGIILPYDGYLYRSTFVNELLSGLQAELFKRNYGMLFIPTRGADSPTMVKNALAIAGGYDGYVLFGTRYCTVSDLETNVEELTRSGYPFVAVNMPEMSYPINQVVLRPSAGSGAIPYLFSLNHRRILIMLGRRNAPDSLNELAGYQNALAAAGIPFDPSLVIYGDYERAAAKSALLLKLKEERDYTAIYCISDTMALGVYDAIAERGLSIPGDLSVIGRHDSFFASYLNPPLTTVRQQIFETGVRAAELLLRRIDSGEDNRKIFLDSELVVRKSVRVLLPGQTSQVSKVTR